MACMRYGLLLAPAEQDAWVILHGSYLAALALHQAE